MREAGMTRQEIADALTDSENPCGGFPHFLHKRSGKNVFHNILQSVVILSDPERSRRGVEGSTHQIGVKIPPRGFALVGMILQLNSFVWFLPGFYRRKEKLTNVQRKAFLYSNTSREHSREVSDETDYSISRRLPSGRRCSSLGRVRRRTPSTYLALILSASTPEMSKLLV